MIKAYIVFCYAFRSGVGLDVRLHLGKLFLFNLARFLIFEKEEKGPYLRRYGGARKKRAWPKVVHIQLRRWSRLSPGLAPQRLCRTGV